MIQRLREPTGPAVTHHLQQSTRLMATLTAGGALVAAVDVLDRHGATTCAVMVSALLVLASVAVARLHRVGLEFTGDRVVVRNVLSTHDLDVADLAEVRAGDWSSLVVLTDGTEIPTLLRTRDLEASPAGDATVPASAA